MKSNPEKDRCRTVGALLALSLGAAAYMLFEAQWLQLRRLELGLRNLPPGLSGLTILHVSDLHAGAFGPGGRAIVKSVEQAARLDPDLVLITGDLTDKKKDLAPVIDLLGHLRARRGRFAVLGNHDHGMRKTFVRDMVRRLTGVTLASPIDPPTPAAFAATVDRNRELLARVGIELLENECRSVTVGEDLVQVCGIDDYQYGFGDLEAASQQFDSGAALRILMTHTPDAGALITPGDYGLVLAGHTHGGQICLPGPGGKILLSSSGSDYGDGIYRMGGTTMHVSRGVGTTLLPFRLLSRPEITLLELRRLEE